MKAWMTERGNNFTTNTAKFWTPEFKKDRQRRSFLLAVELSVLAGSKAGVFFSFVLHTLSNGKLVASLVFRMPGMALDPNEIHSMDL